MKKIRIKVTPKNQKQKSEAYRFNRMVCMTEKARKHSALILLNAQHSKIEIELKEKRIKCVSKYKKYEMMYSKIAPEMFNDEGTTTIEGTNK